MVYWSLEFLAEAERDLAKLDSPIRKRVIDKLDWLVANFENIVPIPLTEELAGFYKQRVGDWRVVYKIDWKNRLITVCYIDLREKIYKRKK